MRRRPLNLLAMLSLVLWAAVVVLWALSYGPPADAGRVRLEIVAPGGMGMHVIRLRHGSVEYEVWRRTVPPPAPGAYFQRWNAAVPLGAAGAVLLCVFLVLLRRHRELRRSLQLDLCPSCGYDLRATRGRCPECGTIV